MYYITTSRPYTNAKPHLGTIMDPIYADVYARFSKRLNDGKVFFSMGTDEHSAKIADKAIELQISPKAYVNNQYNLFKEAFDSLDINYDNFIQSSDPKHHWIANLVWQRLEKRGFIYKKQYQGLYCKGCEDFYSPSQLINGHCPIHTNLEIQKVEEENYFLKLTEFKEQILNYLEVVRVNDKTVISETKNFTNDIQDISISRDKSRLSMDWGVTINSDPNQVMYVWFEALITYLTPLIEDEIYDNWKDADEDLRITIESEVWNTFEERLPQDLQVIGRDNVKFHLVIWPAMLFGLGLQPISSILVHGMINDSEGRKFAKSMGNGVDYDELVQKFGFEGARFFVLYYCNSAGDTNFDWAKLAEMYNANLANNLGNMLMRITTLVEKHLDGMIDYLVLEEKPKIQDSTEGLIDINLDFQGVYDALISLQPEMALRLLFNEMSKINQFMEQEKPWMLAKDLENNKQKLTDVLEQAALSLRSCIEPLSIFLPSTAEAISKSLNSVPIVKSSILFNRIEL